MNRLRRAHFERKATTPPIVTGRVPPHDLDAEAAVLSAILLSREALDRVLDLLKPEHFYSDANGRIYEAALALAMTGGPVDIVEVASYLRARETLARTGGAVYLAQLADATPAVAHVDAHAKTVREKWRVRAVISTCQRVAAEGYGDVGEPQAFIDEAEQAIYALAHNSTRREPRTLREGLRGRFQALTDALERGDTLTGYATGYAKLDQHLAGLRRGNFYVIAARPGMGKTAFVTGLAVNMAAPRPVPRQESHGADPSEELVPGYGVLIASLEMPEEQVLDRMMCAEARVDCNKFLRHMLQADDWRKLTEAGSFMAPLPIWIDDTPAIGVLDLRAKVRRIQAEYNREATATSAERRVGALRQEGQGADALHRFKYAVR